MIRRSSMNRLFQSMLLSLALAFTLPAFAGQSVDINSADATTLAESLDGVGPAKAKAIIEHRTANGPFKSADELAAVKGIGLATVDRNREFIRLGAAKAGK
ncbi:MAG: helix-hairpin-helix domain-containing protein [Xanthomonadales bacterium]|nr:helix-hairpin-helix domain-containing protein [Xanthomonadales bacterium]